MPSNPGTCSRRQALAALLMVSAALPTLNPTAIRLDSNPAPAPGPAGVLRRAAARIRVLCLNTWGLWTAPDRAYRIQKIGERLAAGEFDIVGLQEVWTEADRQTLQEHASAGGLDHSAYIPAENAGSGLMLLSRYPLHDVTFTPYALNGTPFTFDYYATKGVLSASVQTPAGPLDVYNTHAIAQHMRDSLDRYTAHRSSQMYEMARLSTLGDIGHPALLMGDFNVRPDQFGYRVVMGLSGAVDVLETLYPGAPNATYSAENPYKPRTDTRRLDYVLKRDAPSMQLDVLNADLALTVIPETAGTSDVRAYSDHYGIYAEIEMQPVSEDGAGWLAPNPSSSGVQQILKDLAAHLRDGLEIAEARHTRQIAGTASGTLVTLGTGLSLWKANAGQSLKRLLGAGGGVTAAYTLAEGWLSGKMSPQVRQRFEALIDEVESLIM